MFTLALVAMFALFDEVADFRTDSAACGIPASRVMIKPQPDGFAPRISIAGAEPVSSQVMTCLAAAWVRKRYVMKFADPELQRQFLAASEPLQLAETKRMATAWLESRGKPLPVPHYDPTREKLADFAVRLEAFCGATPRSALGVIDNKTLTFALDGAEIEPIGSPRSECAMAAVLASDADAQGVTFFMPLGNRNPLPDE